MTYPTNPIYKFYKSSFSDEVIGVLKANKDSIMSIPIDEANTDYQEYLEWAKTNTAEEAD
jgi:hypothetical protein